MKKRSIDIQLKYEQFKTANKELSEGDIDNYLLNGLTKINKENYEGLKELKELRKIKEGFPQSQSKEDDIHLSHPKKSYSKKQKSKSDTISNRKSLFDETTFTIKKLENELNSTSIERTPEVECVNFNKSPSRLTMSTDCNKNKVNFHFIYIINYINYYIIEYCEK